MKKVTLLVALMTMGTLLMAQNLEVVGKAKITVMDTVADVSSNVVRLSDGTLALRQYKIGDFAQGGIVFWLDETGEHGLVSSQSDLKSTSADSTHQWSEADSAETGATGGTVPDMSVDDKGAGAMNTMLIVSADRADDDSAARLCADLVEGGYGDWYLPSKGEIHLMFTNLAQAGLNGFSDSFYWSSTENGNKFAWRQNFGNGQQLNFSKVFFNRVRGDRAF